MMEILKLIEEVDPADNEALCTINGMVDWCVKRHEWYPGCSFVKAKRYRDQSCPNEVIYLGTDKETHRTCNGFLDYCKSRDALKSIRPDGRIDIGEFSDGWTVRFKRKNVFDIYSAPLPTEELAELHAIIQAIAHERQGQALDYLAKEGQRCDNERD